MIRYDELGVFDIDGALLSAVSGGDASILVPAFGPIVAGPGGTLPSNSVCPSATVPTSAYSGQINGICGRMYMTTAPSGTNLGCTETMDGTNPICFSNVGCPA